MDVCNNTFFQLQVCKIEMVVGSSDANKVVLVADELLMRQEQNMNVFVIKDDQLDNTSNPEEGVMIADIYIFDKYGNFWTSKYILWGDDGNN